MSRKTPGTVSTVEAKPALVPKLRFPEFRGAEGWEEKKLGNEGQLYSSLTGKAGADFDTGEARFVTYMNVFANTFVDPKALRFVNLKEGENQNAVASGDVFFTISSETPDEVGMSSVLLEDLENCYLNSFCALFRFSESKRPNPVFTGYLLRQPLVRTYFTKKAQGSTRFNLSKDAFRSLPLYVPSLAEQQKIADCLSTLDDLITAQARKVEALKTHKKGLMQQLFPREGETQPRLRFPEFRDAVEWVQKTLGEIVEVASGQVDPTLPPYCDYPQIGSENIEANSGKLVDVKSARAKGVISGNYDFDKNDVLYSKIRPALNKAAIPDFDGICSADIYPIRPVNDNLLRIYLFYLLLSPRFLDYAISKSGRGKIPKINRDDLLSFEAVIPPRHEQQRIADCLTSLDTLITTATQELETLKTHKKGLMQQLFPSAEAVEA